MATPPQDAPDQGGAVLTAPYVLEYPYRRSTGPVIGRFLTALRAGRIEGVRAPDGQVLVPPTEYDPRTGESTGEAVAVSAAGRVTTWTWVASPRPEHPLDRPFAFALIQLDGADTAMLHAVDAGSPDAMRAGMRVRARWADAREGSVRDIECFVAAAAGAAGPGDAPADAPGDADPEAKPVRRIVTPSRLEYTHVAGTVQSHYLRGIAQRKLLGRRCPVTGKVYLPARPVSPTSGELNDEWVEVGHAGTVTTFCVVNIPFEGQKLKPPYACAHILLDGADVPMLYQVAGVTPSEIRMGMRVRAVWAPDDQLAPSIVESIPYFEPTGAPDAPYESYREHV